MKKKHAIKHLGSRQANNFDKQYLNILQFYPWVSTHQPR